MTNQPHSFVHTHTHTIVTSTCSIHTHSHSYTVTYHNLYHHESSKWSGILLEQKKEGGRGVTRRKNRICNAYYYSSRPGPADYSHLSDRLLSPLSVSHFFTFIFCSLNVQSDLVYTRRHTHINSMLFFCY